MSDLYRSPELALNRCENVRNWNKLTVSIPTDTVRFHTSSSFRHGCDDCRKKITNIGIAIDSNKKSPEPIEQKLKKKTRHSLFTRSLRDYGIISIVRSECIWPVTGRRHGAIWNTEEKWHKWGNFKTEKYVAAAAARLSAWTDGNMAHWRPHTAHSQHHQQYVSHNFYSCFLGDCSDFPVNENEVLYNKIRSTSNEEAWSERPNHSLTLCEAISKDNSTFHYNYIFL